MQINSFSTGGYVAHKITGYWKGRVSAWFDRDGALLDAEQIIGFDLVRPVKRNGPMWRQLQQIGLRYRHVPLPPL